MIDCNTQPLKSRTVLCNTNFRTWKSCFPREVSNGDLVLQTFEKHHVSSNRVTPIFAERLVTRIFHFWKKDCKTIVKFWSFPTCFSSGIDSQTIQIVASKSKLSSLGLFFQASIWKAWESRFRELILSGSLFKSVAILDPLPKDYASCCIFYASQCPLFFSVKVRENLCDTRHFVLWRPSDEIVSEKLSQNSKSTSVCQFITNLYFICSENTLLYYCCTLATHPRNFWYSLPEV